MSTPKLAWVSGSRVTGYQVEINRDVLRRNDALCELTSITFPKYRLAQDIANVVHGHLAPASSR
ncbi:hypothetical protein [Larsenimonas suaedae]|uniref:Uncharacterized protein n=1 Tax=Larsenimonas suaedae TaxID=1851019 RepID=A0ABU1GZ12_9GAMM|nr:hypothetical protein [Larsenimonas suaedae]MCM2973765.1 hypothetical protein [Larsenimonas suaedae]MDR5897289.1 hypothetical protein [Larsenimonas suaedae]